MVRWLWREREASALASESSVAMPVAEPEDVGLVPGAVVTTYSEALEGWAAAVVVHVEEAGTFGNSVSLLELDWVGSGPPSLAQASEASPLRLTHPQLDGQAVVYET